MPWEQKIGIKALNKQMKPGYFRMIQLVPEMTLAWMNTTLPSYTAASPETMLLPGYQKNHLLEE